jgi:hypothetical protein
MHNSAFLIGWLDQSTAFLIGGVQYTNRLRSSIFVRRSPCAGWAGLRPDWSEGLWREGVAASSPADSKVGRDSVISWLKRRTRSRFLEKYPEVKRSIGKKAIITKVYQVEMVE